MKTQIIDLITVDTLVSAIQFFIALAIRTKRAVKNSRIKSNLIENF